MRISIVVGLGFGDEGKGVVTASLVEQAHNPIVIRFNGGHQAGHTVVKDGHRHVFSTFGSGTLHGAPTYVSHFCTVYPTALLNELELLKKFKPIIYIDPACPITTPWDVLSNQKNAEHGSVGVGFGETIRRQENHFTLYAKDLKYKQVLKAKLASISNHYYNYRFPTFATYKQYMEDIEKMLSLPNIEIGVPPINGDMIFEGAQGIMLDQKFGFFPYVTRSNTTAKNALELMPKGADPNWFHPTVYMVTRAYQTRHGKGPMGYDEPIILKNNEKETNKLNTYQGEFRVRKFNEELVRYAIECEEQIEDFAKVVVMTCCDQVEEIPKLNTRHSILYNSSEEGNFFKKRQLSTETYYE